MALKFDLTHTFNQQDSESALLVNPDHSLESHCPFFAAEYSGGYAIKTPPFEVEEGGTGRGHAPSFCGLVGPVRV